MEPQTPPPRASQRSLGVARPEANAVTGAGLDPSRGLQGLLNRGCVFTERLRGVHRQHEKYVGVIWVGIFWLIWSRESLQVAADFFVPPINCNPFESALQRSGLGGAVDE